MTKVLIIDDDEGICAILKDVLELEGYDVAFSLTGEEGIQRYREHLPSIVLLDLRLPGMDGLAVLKEILGFDPDALVIMITGYGSVDSAVGAIRLGAADYLQKPLSHDEIVIKIENALRNKMLTKELFYLKEYLRKPFRLDSIIRDSEVMTEMVERLQKIALHDKPMLIVGEPGTGKDLAAKAVHQTGRRKEKPMVIFDCSAYPPNAIQNVLFGTNHGAGESTIGKAEEANMGTIYLGRIEWLPREAQNQLLETLQTKTTISSHTKKSKPCDIHVVASTTSDLQKLSREGRFNPELYDLLHQYEVIVPPLRMRENDIPLLAKHFAEEAADEFDLPVFDFDASALRKLLNHTWPGNVRELRNVVRNAVKTAAGEIKDNDISVHGG